jgi:putative glutamine amidotransferase
MMVQCFCVCTYIEKKMTVKNILFSLAVLTITSMFAHSQNVILLSQEKENGHYLQFLHKADSTLILKIAYGQPQDSIDQWLRSASGILLTGGVDIHPALHGKPGEVHKCGKFDRYRDTLELQMVRYAKEHGIPLLGICRGEQMLNVALGGSLYTDIPTDIGKKIKHRKRRKTAMHEVSIDPSSLLYGITGVTSGKVNSFHHQSVDRPAPGIEIAARSADQVVEAIACTAEGWIALGVQWHPERLDFEDPLAGNIARWFVGILE